MGKKGRPELLSGKPSRGGVFAIVIAIILLIVFSIAFVGIWFRNTYTAYRIEKESMQNTLFDGDWVYAEHGAKAERGDIVILDVSGRPSFSADTIIKRLIAVEGDTVMCENGAIFVRYAGTETFERLEEPYAVGACPYFSPCELNRGEIFVLGDNRIPSHDSTEEGPLRAEEIVAVVPGWAVANKDAITKWEKFRSSVSDFFYNLFH